MEMVGDGNGIFTISRAGVINLKWVDFSGRNYIYNVRFTGYLNIPAVG